MSTKQPYTRVVRALREVRGMSQARLAELSGVTTRTIRAIESEGSSPRAGLLLRLLDALNASNDDRGAAMGAKHV